MIAEPKFKTCEIVRMLSSHPDKRRDRGKTSVVMEVMPGRGGRWRYRLMDSDSGPTYYFEDELESTGEFD